MRRMLGVGRASKGQTLWASSTWARAVLWPPLSAACALGPPSVWEAVAGWVLKVPSQQWAPLHEVRR